MAAVFWSKANFIFFSTSYKKIIMCYKYAKLYIINYQIDRFATQNLIFEQKIVRELYVIIKR